MTRGLGEPRAKARLAREGSRRGVLRAGRKKNSHDWARFRRVCKKTIGQEVRKVSPLAQQSVTSTRLSNSLIHRDQLWSSPSAYCVSRWLRLRLRLRKSSGAYVSGNTLAPRATP